MQYPTFRILAAIAILTVYPLTSFRLQLSHWRLRYPELLVTSLARMCIFVPGTAQASEVRNIH